MAQTGIVPCGTTAFARNHGLSIYAPVIIKYRDEKTSTVTALEDAPR